jgi:UDP-glucose 4-epimerase
MRVLVTGGAGYIGSHAVKALLTAGHSVTVLDNLSRGHRAAVDPRSVFVRGNTGDRTLVRRVLLEGQIEAVMHFAADIEVGESVSDPGKYYENNFSNALSLLEAMKSAGVARIVFSSTAAVYGNPEKTPIEEEQQRAPINPYGRSKMMTEMAIEDFGHAHGLGYAILRYFNVAGASPDASIGEDHQPESHLIPRILQSAQSGGVEKMRIFGTDYPTRDGTCVRDYVHVVDLVQAHVLALDALAPGTGEVYNLGSEQGFSVREVLSTCEKVIGRKIEVQEENRRPGDPPTLVASSRKVRSRLGWAPKYASLDTIVSHAWAWCMAHPQGYRTESKRASEPATT